tara:strand:+ start:97 stop:285 length:189 start_codon:yes stop_codon:yes gene_type:complete
MSININNDYSLKFYEANKSEREKTGGGQLTAAPFRIAVNGAPTLRLQNNQKRYETFIGEQKL